MLQNVLNSHKITDTELYKCFQDSGREIDKLCSFLGLSPSADDREKVITGVSFDSMKKNNMTNYTLAEGLNHKVSPFMRKGTFYLSFSFVLNFTLSCTKMRLNQCCWPHKSLCRSRKSRWLEEPFHSGPEWNVWRTLQAEDEEFKIEVSLWTLGPFHVCLNRTKTNLAWFCSVVLWVRWCFVALVLCLFINNYKFTISTTTGLLISHQVFLNQN